MENFRALLVLFLIFHASFRVLAKRTQGSIGVCYGLNGNNLPSPKDVVNLYKRYKIQKMRIYEPYPQVLEALRGSNIDLTLGIRNNDIPTLASSEGSANSWFMTNVRPYINDINITYINVGNEVIPGEFSESILPAMQNLQSVLRSNRLRTRVTTVVHSAVLNTSFPPSASTFSDSARPYIRGIIQFLSSQKSALLVNLYPYFPYAAEPQQIRLDYAQFYARRPLVTDGNLRYSNLLDAMLDGFFAAMEKENVTDVNLVVSETGWPHAANGNSTTTRLAGDYNRGLIWRIKHFNGTLRKPDASLDAFIFAIFDEDLKDPGVEQQWGIFSPNMQPNYDIKFFIKLTSFVSHTWTKVLTSFIQMNFNVRLLGLGRQNLVV